MLKAKKDGGYIDDKTEKREARLQQKKKSSSHSKSQTDVNDEPIEGEKDLDPELRKVNDEGRRVGWAYRYRIRRKLDDLKQQQAGKFQCQKKTFILLFLIRRNGNTI
jgi:hypothetical protein